jgi:hypothetical protein
MIKKGRPRVNTTDLSRDRGSQRALIPHVTNSSW